MSSYGLKVPSSLTAWLHGMLTAPGMWPPRCACSVGYSGGANTSPLNSLGLLTSTNLTLGLLCRSRGCPYYYMKFSSGLDAWKLVGACLGMSLVRGLSSSIHFLRPPLMSTAFL